jgi:hypothetical protein
MSTLFPYMEVREVFSEQEREVPPVIEVHKLTLQGFQGQGLSYF